MRINDTSFRIYQELPRSFVSSAPRCCRAVFAIHVSDRLALTICSKQALRQLRWLVVVSKLSRAIRSASLNSSAPIQPECMFVIAYKYAFAKCQIGCQSHFRCGMSRSSFVEPTAEFIQQLLQRWRLCTRVRLLGVADPKLGSLSMSRVWRAFSASF